MQPETLNTRVGRWTKLSHERSWTDIRAFAGVQMSNKLFFFVRDWIDFIFIRSRSGVLKFQLLCLTSTAHVGAVYHQTVDLCLS